MFGRMMRANRRLLVGMGLLSLFLALGWVTGLGEQPIPTEELQSTQGMVIFAIALFIVIFGCIALPVWVLAAVAPGMLAVVDLMLLTLVITVPVTVVFKPLGLPGFAYFAAFLAIYLGLQRIFYGPWLAGVGQKDTRTYRAVFEVPETIETVWAKLAPLPENAKTFYWPKAEFRAAPEGSGADFVLFSPRRWGLQDAIEAAWVEHHVPGREVTLRLEPQKDSFSANERLSLRLSPVGARTRIEIEVTFLQMSPFHRFRVWLGHDAREFALSLKSHALGRPDRTVFGRQARRA